MSNPEQPGPIIPPEEITCPECGGSGLITERDGREVICPICDGKGYISV